MLLQTPTYNGFYSDLTASQTKAEDVPLKVVNGKYAMDFTVRAPHQSRHPLLHPVQPAEPDRQLRSAADLTRIGEICLKHRVSCWPTDSLDWVTRARSTRRLPASRTRRSQHSLTFKAASKSFGLALTRSPGSTRPTPS